ncbi:MAG: hypothetical protein ACPL4E_02825 [Thermoproteota archaeon]
MQHTVETMLVSIQQALQSIVTIYSVSMLRLQHPPDAKRISGVKH